ncbi:MAG TPA: hypothetical protein VLD57_02365, partial [Blastocatellia bacterium]|nr:hypothetical protein [Blastocatellia bacterium]
VFGRGSEFDPRTNSIVRVQAKNLRARLQEYYETEGRSDRVLIELPKGHYRAAFSYLQPKEDSTPPQEAQTETSLPPSTAPAAPVEAEREPVRRADFTTAVLIATIITLSAVITLLALPNISLYRQPQKPASAELEDDHAVVWSPFLKSNAPTLLVLSNPAVYRFLNNSDSKTVTKEAIQLPPEQEQRLARVLENKLIMKQGRAPRLVLSTSNYTGIGEAIGLYHLTDLFRSKGREVSLKQSRTVSAEDLKNHNVIMLGSSWVNDWVEKLPVKEDFVYGVNASIENKAPLPGEELEYKPRYNEQTGVPEEDYAVITVKPGVTEEHRLMILAGLLSEGTQAAVEYVTRKEYLRELNRRLQQTSDEDGPPKYYQVLLKVGVDDGIPTRVTILSIHPLRVTRN